MARLWMTGYYCLMGVFDQAEFDVRCEWGADGVMQLAPISDVIIIVDVLSFSTCVEIGVNRGAKLYPYRFKDASAAKYAASIAAELAGGRSDGSKFSLSPRSMCSATSGLRLVLPSPNGSTLSLETGNCITLAGSLRNASAIAQSATELGKTIAVIPAGERWRADNSLRPSFEDLIGAGAIISYLGGKLTLSPEAKLARESFLSLKSELTNQISACSSGKELIQKGFIEDVELACAFNASNTVPILRDGAYIQL